MKQLQIATSPLTNRIFVGHVLNDGCTWAEGKQDITGPACGAVAEHVLANKGPVTVMLDDTPMYEISVRVLGEAQ